MNLNKISQFTPRFVVFLFTVYGRTPSKQVAISQDPQRCPSKKKKNKSRYKTETWLKWCILREGIPLIPINSPEAGVSSICHCEPWVSTLFHNPVFLGKVWAKVMTKFLPKKQTVQNVFMIMPYINKLRHIKLIDNNCGMGDVKSAHFKI